MLQAIATTAHHNKRRILALAATEEAGEYAINHRYADTTTGPAVVH